MADLTKSTLLLEESDTLAEKVQKIPQSYQSPQNFDFYGKNFVKDKAGSLQLENRIRTDIIKRISIYENTFFPKWIQAIKDYVLCTVDRALELKRKNMSYRTNEKQPIIRTYVDRLVQTIFRANFSLKAYAQSEKNFKRTKAVQRFVEWCFSSSEARQGLIDQATTAILIGP